MHRVSPPVRSALVGAVIGAALTALVAVNDQAPIERTGPKIVSAFLADWRHQFVGTYVVVLNWERRTAAGGRLQSTETIAQRPPDTFSRGLGTIDARRGDRRLACAEGPSGRLDCRDAGALPAYATVVDQRVANVATYLRGPARIYDVERQQPHCYRLKQVVPVRFAIDLSFGTEAFFCFDPVTGALRSRRTVRPSSEDAEVAASIRTFVTDADLAPKPGTPGGETFGAP
ncbi:MAG: hypothetical protein JWO37_3612 [Acidimicrobiales bacterium]|nr:hypothetical protein [Acidimicrobiales bacterium]